MRARVVPAVLGRSLNQVRRQWQLASEFSDIVHLDLADGTLTTQRTVSQKTLASLNPQQFVEIHIMSKHPDRWLATVLRVRTKRVILHVELGASLRPYIALFRTHRIPVVVAINPSTPLERLTPWISSIQGVQIMGVVPGQFGARWHPKTISRITKIRHRWPRLSISCDGGMRPTTIPSVVRAGASTVIVGSYLQQHEDPDSGWKELRSAVRAG